MNVVLVNAELRSCLYEGVVVHDRIGDPPHRLRRRVMFAYLDTREIDEVAALSPLWSSRRSAFVRFRRKDFLGDPDQPLDGAVRSLVERQTGVRPEGPVTVLATLRVWGWSFNPIACYFCFDPEGHEVQYLVAEVTNTPWGERHPYVIGPPGVHRFAKEFHVSPFMPMDMTYTVRYREPGEHCSVAFDVDQGAATRLRASMALTRVELTRRTMRHMALRPWLGSPGFTLAIYRNALSLTRRGARFYRHPAKEDVA